MSSSFVVPKGASDFVSTYISEEQIHLFRSGVDVSFSRDEDRVILEIWLTSKRVTSPISFNTQSSYLYFYPPFIKDTGVLFPISVFSIDILKVLNVSHFQLFMNIWGYVRVFEMVCEGLDINPTTGVFFSLFATKPVKGTWVTLRN